MSQGHYLLNVQVRAVLSCMASVKSGVPEWWVTPSFLISS